MTIAVAVLGPIASGLTLEPIQSGRKELDRRWLAALMAWIFFRTEWTRRGQVPRLSALGQKSSRYRKFMDRVAIKQLTKQVQVRLLQEVAAPALAVDQARLHDKIRAILNDLLAQEPLRRSPAEQRHLLAVVTEAILGLGPLEPLLHDPTVTEIMVNGPALVYVERYGKIERAPVTFEDDEHVKRIIDRIIAPLGRRCDESLPYVDARLPDGSRIHAIIPPLAPRGPTLTIRKFPEHPLAIEELLRLGTLTAEVADFLRAAVLTKLNMLISGGTGSGKTSLLNVLSSFIPPTERIVTIEDTAELQLQQEHWVPLESRKANIEGAGAVTIRDLVMTTLRMRPDRIVVGECRGGEALDMLQALNSGHDGGLTTVHANSPADALSRLEVMCLLSGMELPVLALQRQIASAIHLVVQMQRFTDGSRRITQVTEVLGLENGLVATQDLFRFEETGVNPVTHQVVGELRPTGAPPTFRSARAGAGQRLALLLQERPTPASQSATAVPGYVLPPAAMPERAPSWETPQPLAPAVARPSAPSPIRLLPAVTPNRIWQLAAHASSQPGARTEVADTERLRRMGEVDPLSELQALPVVLYTQGTCIAGELRTSHRRFSDALNTLGHDFIELHDATILSLQGEEAEPQSMATVLIGVDAIVVAVSSEPLAGQERSLAHQAVRVPRRPAPALLRAWPYTIAGTLHLANGGDLLQHLRVPHRRFLPVTEATITYTPDRALSFQQPVVLVNRLHVEAAVDVSLVAQRAVADEDLRQRPALHQAMEGEWAAQILAACPLFKQIDVAQLERMCGHFTPTGHLRWKRVGAGTDVFAQGDEGDTMYIVEEGRLEATVVMAQDQARGRHLATFGPSDIFGEMALLGEPRRTATVRARTDATLLALHETAVRALMAQFPAVATSLLNLMVQRQAAIQHAS